MNKTKEKEKSVKSRRDKEEKALEVARIARSIGKRSANSNLDRYARCIVNPGSCDPTVFPSVVPGRAGAAKIPLVVDLKGQSNYGIIVKPSLDNPVRISDTTVTDFSDSSTGSKVIWSNDQLNTLEGCEPCETVASYVGEKAALPLESEPAPIVTTITWRMGVEFATDSFDVDLLAYDTATQAWVVVHTENSVGLGKKTTSKTGLVWLPSYSHYSFACRRANGGNLLGAVVWSNDLVPGGAGKTRCGGIYNEFVLKRYPPDWKKLRNASDAFRIVAVDCLVTYQGSTLENSGSIACCNTDDDLVLDETFYKTVASRPHDMYEGRLASEGKTEGGCHWHYVPNDPEQLFLQRFPVDEGELPACYIGIAGARATEEIRVRLNFMVNFYSRDPSYSMTIQPPMTDFSALLYAVRSEVDMCTSNDSHLNKAKKVLRAVGNAGASGVKFAKEHDREIARALQLMAMAAV